MMETTADIITDIEAAHIFEPDDSYFKYGSETMPKCDEICPECGSTHLTALNGIFGMNCLEMDGNEDYYVIITWECVNCGMKFDVDYPVDTGKGPNA